MSVCVYALNASVVSVIVRSFIHSHHHLKGLTNLDSIFGWLMQFRSSFWCAVIWKRVLANNLMIFQFSLLRMSVNVPCTMCGHVCCHVSQLSSAANFHRNLPFSRTNLVSG